METRESGKDDGRREKGRGDRGDRGDIGDVGGRGDIGGIGDRRCRRYTRYTLPGIISSPSPQFRIIHAMSDACDRLPPHIMLGWYMTPHPQQCSPRVPSTIHEIRAVDAGYTSIITLYHVH